MHITDLRLLGGRYVELLVYDFLTTQLMIH